MKSCISKYLTPDPHSTLKVAVTGKQRANDLISYFIGRQEHAVLRIYTQLFKPNTETGFTSKHKQERTLNLTALCNFTNIYYLQGPGTKGEGEMASH